MLILAVCVEVIPLYSRRSPPTVTRTLCTSFLCGLRLATSLAYVTLRPSGIAWRGMNRMVLVPFLIRVPTPCASIPRSLASARFHRFFAGVWMRCRYSRALPETSSMTELHTSVLKRVSMCCSAFACRFAWEIRVLRSLIPENACCMVRVCGRRRFLRG